MIGRTLPALFAASFVAVSTIAAAEQWTIFKPGNTGIGGNQVEGFRLDPQGRPWVGARYPIQEDGGVSTFDGTKWTNYSTIDNLMPSEFVYSMAFAPDGTRWFGTDVGLVHHYGDHFTLFNSSNCPLPYNFIRSLQVDGSGRVWMVYWDPGWIFTGVARLDGSTWTIWPHNTALGFGDATSLGRLEIASNGHVWVGSNSSAGMARWNGTSWSKVVPGAGAAAPFDPYLGRDGRIWVLAGGDVRVLNSTTWLAKPLPATEGYFWTALHAMPDGTYFVGNWQGQLAYNNGSVWKSMWTPAAVMSIQSNAAGELWWVSLKRLYKFVSWGSWRVFHSGNTGLTEYFADSLSFDTAGRLWVGTSGGGACSFDGTVWRGYNPYNDGSEPWGLPTDYVAEIMGAKDGSVWIATGNSAARWNGTSWTQYGYGFMKNDVTEGPSNSIHATWDINTESGIGIFNGSDFARTNFMGAPLYGGEPRDLFVDGAGKMYCGTQTGLISNETGSWVRTDMATIVGPYGSAALCVTKAPNGDLWVGTSNGAARRRGGVWSVFTKTNSGLPANTILAISVRPDGLVAFGAFDGSTWPYHGGAATFDGANWKKWTYGNSPIQHEQVEDVKFDGLGNLWVVSQSEGIARIALGVGTGYALDTLLVIPNALPGGLTTTAQVKLSGPAPAGGVVATLSSASPLATVPASVLVPAGSSIATFPVKTGKVTVDTTVSVSATAGVVTRSAAITLQRNHAGYYGQWPPPTTMFAGQKYDVQMTYRNMGSSTWTDGAGFRLASRNPADNKTFGTNRLRLNPVLSVQPGELGNFMGTITAPSVPGTYVWQWKPLLNGVGTFGDESPAMQITVVAPQNGSQYVSQTVPTSVKAGATFSASITMRNVGTNPWSHDAGYRMQSRTPTDNAIWGTNRLYIASGVSVPTNATYTFSRTFKAPITPGTYTFQWKMLLNGVGSFGETTPARTITVTP